ncbi:putative loganate O-methyltransferase [Rosa chinensis]|uniref:Putative loganate O-methyltransferase n=1 Tax=Rosa chinensis TaxID=74649 RepID=A0A2P6P209_ROSCH|nr:putative loganate O-methyltransferase [Rosa chinensis]
MLFKTLPQNKRYYAAGVSGSFYGRLFPNASIHIAHSSYAIPWLSRVPKAVMDSSSPAWNKGRIHYSDSTDEVIRAYETQYTEDMKCFLQARAHEIVYGGLIVLTFPGRLDGTPHSDAPPNVIFQLLGSSIQDLVTKGVVSKEKLDSFNIPTYNMSPQELVAVVERNKCFSIEKMVDVPLPLVHDPVLKAQLLASHVRAGMEGDLLKQQFGEEILDELFNLFRKKCEEHDSRLDPEKSVNFLVVLRRKVD